ncbi:MAG: HAD family hydrolase [Nanoarchaeota archaeon]|nr:HAD family hydrolase [Nanoarchaeota archaeon]
MQYKVISFDLQGTLSDHLFSDEFWIEILPKFYSEKNNISLEQAKKDLHKQFKEIGRYDFRYYSVKYWLKKINMIISFKKIIKLTKNKPLFFDDVTELVKDLSKKVNLVISSSTTKDFINVELGVNKKYFKKVFSSLDDFNIPGKPKEFYLKLAKKLGVKPEEILHVGDDEEMDIKNARLAGLNTFYFDRKLPREELINRLNKFLR